MDDLTRYCPVLRLDSRERYAQPTNGAVPGIALRRADGHPMATQPLLDLAKLTQHEYVEQAVMPGDFLDRPSLPSTIYARAVKEADRTYLQYWLWFAQDRSHEGDWESVVLRMGVHAPDLAGYAQHSSGQQRAWPRVERTGGRPVVYVARGSHASYFERGTYLLPSWSRLDHANGWGCWKPQALEIIDQPGWMLWPGRWGRDEKSPTSPSRHWAWRDPAGWLASLPLESLSRKLF